MFTGVYGDDKSQTNHEEENGIAVHFVRNFVFTKQNWNFKNLQVKFNFSSYLGKQFLYITYQNCVLIRNLYIHIYVRERNLSGKNIPFPQS